MLWSQLGCTLGQNHRHTDGFEHSAMGGVDIAVIQGLRICVYICIYMRMCLHVYICTYICMCMCIYACMYRHTRTHIYTHIYMHLRAHPWRRLLPWHWTTPLRWLPAGALLGLEWSQRRLRRRCRYATPAQQCAAQQQPAQRPAHMCRGPAAPCGEAGGWEGAREGVGWAGRI